LANECSGKYYGIAAAFGKLGAFVGSKVFPLIAAAGADKVKGGQYQFYVGASLAIFSAFLSIFLPELHQDVVADEDIRWREFLEKNGYDTSTMGQLVANSTEGTIEIVDKAAK
jgi:nitrate/nitrite transporter NarK